MAFIFDTVVSIGKSKRSHKIWKDKLRQSYFDTPAEFKGDVDDKDGMYFCRSLFSGTVRGNDHMTDIVLIAIDIDDMSAQEIRRIKFLLDDSHYCYVMHSTTRHTPKEPRYRLILKPSREMTEDEHLIVVNKVCEDFMIKPCKASKQPATPMFLPLVIPDGHYDIEHRNDGDPIDVDSYKDLFVASEITDSLVNEDYKPSLDDMPMTIPGALPEEIWLTAVMDSYPALNCDYYGWLDMGLALWHQTDGRGFDLWLRWSRKHEEVHGHKISEDQMESSKWPSFDPSKKKKRPLTLRNILNRKLEGGRKVLALAYSKTLSLIDSAADLKRLREDIQSDEFMHAMDYRPVMIAYQEASERITGDKLSQGEAMLLLKNSHMVEGKRDYFGKNYVFSTLESTYYHVRTKAPMPVTSINYVYGDHMPLMPSGERKIVHKVLTNGSNGFAKPQVVSGFEYIVNGEAIVTVDRRNYLNLFIEGSWPAADGPFDRYDAIDKTVRTYVDKHLGLLCNNDPMIVMMVKQHLAHLRQHPGKRIHWAYAISSYFQGVGKSVLKQLYETVLGEDQINVLTAEDVAEKYNEYAMAPYLMTFIEEFEFDTRREQNRAIKKMKDMITSDKVSVRVMRATPHKQQARTAYALFSNDEYVLGHESTGRRWVPIVVEAANADQASQVLGVDRHKFFADYDRLMKRYPERFVAYFESISVEGFNYEVAPAAGQKHMFIEAVPVARAARVLQEIQVGLLSDDVTNEYVLGNAALAEVKNYIDFNDDADTDELGHFNNAQLRNLITKALKVKGYKQLHQSSERIRMPFEHQQRARMDDIWVMDHPKYAATHGLTLLRRLIIETNEKRAEKVGTIPRVVKMDGQPYGETHGR